MNWDMRTEEPCTKEWINIQLFHLENYDARYYPENLLSKYDVTWGTDSYGPFCYMQVCLQPYSARVKQDNVGLQDSTKAKLQGIQAGPSVWRFLNEWLSNRNVETSVTHAPTRDSRRPESHHRHTILECSLVS